jgi:hypothetical protein
MTRKEAKKKKDREKENPWCPYSATLPALVSGALTATF